MKRVIKVSKAWIAAFFFGIVLVGCGGGDSSGEGSSSEGSAGLSGTATGSDSGTPGVVADVPRFAVLSWSAPATRVNGDGIDMGELDSYVIRYGKDVEDLSGEVVIDGAAKYPEMSYTVDNLDVGTWYFTIQVQDTQGLVSEPSEPVSKTIRS
ncbi:fibronectin type III domain-containing protein [Marinobacter sp.]|uniref:fibronectin type III domain-containing protein n=1 Tax=Marinobacter sp. TaxID=50741 RepID=UPI0025BB8E56|nr:fibronectin type III domain-containing protein [Marinobacter sp.]